jgi:hypothetical protein
VRLDLEPVARPLALGVARVGALGDHALEPLLARRLEQRRAVVEGLGDPDRPVAAVEQLVEPLAPFGERPVEERLPLHLEDVEDVVDDRRSRLPLLHGREARSTLLVERADLAVEHRVRGPERLRQLLRHVGEADREVVAVPARERRLPARDPTDRAEPVPLHLEDPAVARRELRGERREHRPVFGALRGRGRPVVALADDEPVLRIAAQLRRDERPRPVEPLAVQTDGQPAVFLLLHELVGAAVPDLDRTGAVLPLRDLALEARVLERVVLDVDGEVLLARLERHALRHRPARERAVTLEAEVVVEPPRVVALDDEDGRALRPRPS